MNNTPYESVAHLPHIVSFPCTGANFLHTRMELELSRPRAFFWARTPTDQKRRITFLEPTRTDFAWVQCNVTVFESADLDNVLPRTMFLYDEPVATIYGWLTFGGQEIRPERIEPTCALLRRTMDLYMFSPAIERLDMRKWLSSPRELVDRVREFIEPSNPAVLPPPVGDWTITWPMISENDRVNSASVCHLSGGRGLPTTGVAFDRFREEFGPTIERLVMTDRLAEALQK